MEKIYSRRRLKVVKFKKITKMKLAIVLIILGLLLIIIRCIMSFYPVFEQICKNKANSLAADITSNELNKIMSNYDYDDLVYIERDDNR